MVISLQSLFEQTVEVTRPPIGPYLLRSFRIRKSTLSKVVSVTICA